MILTIQCPSSNKLRQGVWLASVMMGLDTQIHADNTFDVTAPQDKHIRAILNKCEGQVIAQVSHTIV